MTTPTATNTDPALRERIAAAGSVIARVAEREAATVLTGCARWVANTNAETGAEAEMGRPLSPIESVAIERCIGAHLVRWVPPSLAALAHPSPAEMVREHGARSHRTDVNFKDGVTAERARLRAILVAMAESGTADRAHVLALAEGLR